MVTIRTVGFPNIQRIERFSHFFFRWVSHSLHLGPVMLARCHCATGTEKVVVLEIVLIVAFVVTFVLVPVVV